MPSGYPRWFKYGKLRNIYFIFFGYRYLFSLYSSMKNFANMQPVLYNGERLNMRYRYYFNLVCLHVPEHRS